MGEELREARRQAQESAQRADILAMQLQESQRQCNRLQVARGFHQAARWFSGTPLPRVDRGADKHWDTMAIAWEKILK